MNGIASIFTRGRFSVSLPLAAAVLATGVVAAAQPPKTAVTNRTQAQAQVVQKASRQKAARVKAAQTFAVLPLTFEQNEGQTNAQVKFLSRGRGYTLFVTPNQTVFAMREKSASGSSAHPAQSALSVELHSRVASSPAATATAREAVLRVSLAGANTAPQIEGVKELRAKTNYLIGKNPKNWLTGVPNYAAVEAAGVYPGIDLLYHSSKQGRLEYDFQLSPGANPQAIRLRFTGGKRLSLDKQGNLLVAFAGATLTEQAPVIYQQANGARRTIDGGWVLLGAHEAGFKVAAYNRSRQLVIDPQLTYSTFLGGTVGGGDKAEAVAIDTSGDAYLTGYTASQDFPMAGSPYQSTNYAITATCFVSKIDPSQSGAASLIYSTYLGGSTDDEGYGIAVDSNTGNAYVTGLAYSTDFPVTSSAYQPTNPSFLGPVAFVTELNSTGSALIYSTFLGDLYTYGSGIDVDTSGRAYVTGFTLSNAIPTTANAYQSTYTATGGESTFVSIIDPSQSGAASLVYSTYLSGTAYGIGSHIAVDPSTGITYLTGYTASTDFPVSSNAYQKTLKGSIDAYVTVLNPYASTRSQLIYSSYLGGTTTTDGTTPLAATQYGSYLVINSAGDAVITGTTDSTGFPVTSNAYQSTATAAAGQYPQNTFVAEFDPNAKRGNSSLVYSTYLGGTGIESGIGVGTGPSGNIYVTGRTTSTDFPVSSDALQSKNNITDLQAGAGTDFFSVLNPSASGTGQLVFSTYLGGSTGDYAAGLQVTPTGTAYLAGYTASTDYPPTGNAYQASAPLDYSTTYCAGGTPCFNGAAFLSVISISQTTSSGCSGPAISASLLNGDPNPTAGSTGTWTFQIAVCPNQNLTSVSAQGTTNKWESTPSWSPNTASVTSTSQRKGGYALVWTLGAMTQGTEADLDVTVSGTVSSHCGKVQYLNGGWTLTSTAGGTTTTSSPTAQIPITSTCQ